MKKPTLVVMAAGMGSRFGGLKQITPVDGDGNSLLHYSIYDAMTAGFGKVVFIIKHAIDAEFRELTRRVERHIETAYVYQENDVLPEGFSAPEGRVKPWGTGHAVLCAKDELDGPFAVINSDDYYGRGAYTALADFWKQPRTEHEFCMVGYRLRNAMTDSGYVARGVCDVQDGFLTGITERTHIEKRGDDAEFTLDGKTWQPLSGDTVVSMNCWGFSTLLLDELEARFPAFLRTMPDPLKSEFFLPTVADAAIHDGLASVRMLHTNEHWYGVTYREDLGLVQQALAKKHAEGLYPEHLFD